MMLNQAVQAENLDIAGGLLAACLLALFGFVCSLGFYRVKTVLTAVYMVMLVRLVVPLAGAILVLIVLGKNLGIPCVLGLIPLYMVELVIGTLLMFRRSKRKEHLHTEKSESNT